LFVPRDFDVSPYFSIVKPSLAAGFDPRSLAWHEKAGDAAGVERAAAGKQPEPAA
jgi:hypothetical protein